MPKDEMKPCPWCGNEPKKYSKSNCGYFYVECRLAVCHVRPRTDYYKTKREAVSHWNRRKGEDDGK